MNPGGLPPWTDQLQYRVFYSQYIRAPYSYFQKNLHVFQSWMTKSFILLNWKNIKSCPKFADFWRIPSCVFTLFLFSVNPILPVPLPQIFYLRTCLFWISALTKSIWKQATYKIFIDSAPFRQLERLSTPKGDRWGKHFDIVLVMSSLCQWKYREE